MFDYEYWGTNDLPMSSNQALEEYMLERSARLNAATVRFWNVSKDAIVLGYGESESVVKKVDGTFDLERRITGGSHIQFDPNCFAYSFTAPRDGSFRYFEDMRKYYAAKISEAFQELGIEVSAVDNRASTINVDDKVVASHAIFWGVKSALLHGLMVINDYDVDRILERVMLKERKIGKHVYSEYSALKNIPAISKLLDKRLDSVQTRMRADFVKRLIAKEVLKQVTEGKYAEKKLTERTVQEAHDMIARTHLGSPWVDERKPAFKKTEAEAIPGEELDGPLKKDLGYCLYSQVKDRDFMKMSDQIE
jgi:lipoate-protein ligase A